MTIPFWDLVKLLVKISLASIPAVFILFIVGMMMSAAMMVPMMAIIKLFGGDAPV
jgi:hypothetical protein